MQQRRRRMPSVKKIRNAEKWVANDISIVYVNWDNFECLLRDLMRLRRNRKKGRSFQVHQW